MLSSLARAPSDAFSFERAKNGPRPVNACRNGASGFCAISAKRADNMLEKSPSTVFCR